VKKKPAPIVDSCAFLPCDQVERCALSADGSCNQKKFPQHTHQDTLKKGAPALVGKKPPRKTR